MSSWDQNVEIQIFREYLRINTSQPNVDYESAVKFLLIQAERVGLPAKIYRPGGPNKPVVVMTWLGTDPGLSTIILNSHIDTVPAEAEFWTHPPYAADIDKEGRIYGRGTQDMKSMGTQYLAAILELKLAGVHVRRTIHVVFVPDEEIGGVPGWGAFVETADFRSMNVGFHLDEGNASPNDVLQVFYGERCKWEIEMKISGTAGHGSLLLQSTAGEKLNRILSEYIQFRNKEYRKLTGNPKLSIGDVTTANLTVINGGLQRNVVPPLITIVMDIRLAIDMPFEEMDREIQNWVKAGGEGVELRYRVRGEKVKPSPVDDSNVFTKALRQALDYLGLKYQPSMRRGASDGKFLRQIGIPSIGFTAMANTPVLLHANDEYIHADTYLEGIRVYKEIIERLGNAE